MAAQPQDFSRRGDMRMEAAGAACACLALAAGEAEESTHQNGQAATDLSPP